MPSTTPEYLARKQARRLAKQKQREAADPAYRKARNDRREALRKARLAADPAKIEARKAQYKARQDSVTAMRQAFQNSRPFVGCDGEGARDGNGRSSYVLFRIGERELCRDGARLTTPDLLSFILGHPSADDILVGFFFEYDISNILFDVSSARDPAKPSIPSPIEKILAVDLMAKANDPNPYQFGGWTRLAFDGYPPIGVKYLPRNQIEVCRLAWLPRKIKGVVRFGWRSVEGSIRRIYDVQGFFQCSFLKALELWGVGPEHHAGIAAMKDARSSFAGVTQQVRDYCAIECRLLAEMMEAFRLQCIATGMVPRTWNGAGKIGAALLKAHGAMTHKRLLEITPPAVLDLAHAAYYGGRFETPWIGRLPETWEHDIGSAYPAAMLGLPCLEHGRWIEVDARQLDQLGDDLFVARVRYYHPSRQFLCGLPHRSKQGRLSWPREGNGVYWSPEIRSAERLGARIEYKGGWRFERGCDCQASPFIRTLYEQRLKIGKSVRGIPIKLGLNSMYGKKAQRIGKPTYASPIDAGLITAITRAAINDAIVKAGDPRRVAMIATDGVYTVEGPIVGLDLGEGLGQWEAKRYPSLFIVRPGLYWPPVSQDGQSPFAGAGSPASNRKFKTRGLSPKFFEPLIPAFERAWEAWLDDGASSFGVPIVPVPIETFVGVRLALRLKDPGQACQWIKRDVKCAFQWTEKRRGMRQLGEAIVTGSLPGSPDAHSHHYDANSVLASSTVFDEDRMIFEAMPDYLDLGAPFSDDALPDDPD
jgi:DNA polymerase type B, organellar and viral